MPTISVIVPVYNAEQFIAACLDSILAQSRTDFEILCVDDGSNDSSLEILESYKEKDSRIRVFSRKNGGEGAARNTGLEQARGKFIAFVDADDFVDQDWLKKSIGKLESSRADIVIYPVRAYHTQMKRYKDMPWSCQAENFPEIFCWKDNPDKIFSSFQNWAWNKVFSASFLKENDLRFQEVLRTGDLAFTCEALILADRITTIKSPVYFYRIGNPQSNLATNDRAPFDFLEAHLALKEFLDSRGLFTGQLDRSFTNWTCEGVLYNLTTFKHIETSREVFEYLKTSGLEKLGLISCSPDLFDKPDQRTLIRSIPTSDFEHYIFNHFKYSLRTSEACIDDLECGTTEIYHSPTYRAGAALLALPRTLRHHLSEPKAK